MEGQSVIVYSLRAGSLTLIGGDPGVGKSTLLLQLAGLLASSDPGEAPEASESSIAGSQNVLYVSAEESAEQVCIGNCAIAVLDTSSRFPDFRAAEIGRKNLMPLQ